MLSLILFHLFALLPLIACVIRSDSTLISPEDSSYLLLAHISLSDNLVINASALAGSYYSAGLALGSTNLVFQGGDNTKSIDEKTLTSPISIPNINSGAAFASDLRNQSIYGFLTSSNELLSEPGKIAALQLLSRDGKQFDYSSAIIPLSKIISVGYGSAIFSGLDRIIVADADSLTAYQISLPSGEVTTLGGFLLRWQPSDAWYSIGIAEFFSRHITALVYGSVVGKVERQYLDEDPNLEEVASYNFHQLSAITVDINRSLWYFYYAGTGPFTNNEFPTSIGYASASFSELLPTSQPSGQPTSRPTFIPAAPKFTSISVSPTRTTARLTITIDSRSTYSGTVFCAAFRNTTAVYSGNTIAVNGFSSSYIAGQTALTVTIRNLIPITTYASYCYVTTFDDLRSTTIDIANSKQIFQTSCCKTITLTNSPANIFSDPSRYLNQPAKSYTFFYTLSNLPSDTVSIVPVLRHRLTGIVVAPTTVKITPASLSFTSASLTTSGNFILAATSTSFSGNYRVSLVATGTSAAEYGTANTTVTFLSATSTPPPPRLSLAIFGDGGSDIYLVFDSATNLGGFTYSQRWTCGTVFSFPGANATQCYWLNTTAIRGVFQNVVNTSLLANIGNTVQLLPRRIRAQCASTVSPAVCNTYNFSLPQTVSLSAPLNPVTPTVILRMPPSVGSCDNVTIDTTLTSGFGGRSWSKVEWSVSQLSGTGGDVPAILASLNKFGKNVLRTFTVPRTYFGSGRFSISLSLTNFLQVTSTASNVINAISNPNIPRVNILGGSAVTVFAYQPLTVYSSVAFASCVDTSNTIMLYSWTLTANGNAQNFSIISRDPSIYQLNPYTLTSGVVYTLSLNATALVKGQIGGFSIATQAITVAFGEVQAIIRGGNSRQVALDQSIVLDGSTSLDQDVESNSNLAFRWGCSIASFNGFGDSCDEVLTSSQLTSQRMTVLGTAMSLDFTYSITLTVRAPDGRLSSTAILVSPIEAGSAATSIVASSSRFSVNANFTLDAVIQSNFSVAANWRATVNQQNYSFASFSPLSISLPSNFVRNGFRYSLVVAAGAFTAGTTVLFSITATPTGDNIVGTSSQSQIELIANGPPENGELLVDPMTGQSLTTNFFLQANGWLDDPSDYPLTTVFKYAINPTAPPLGIQAESTLTSVTSTFPAGLQSNDYMITLYLSVFDAYGAEALSTNIITVVDNPNANVTDYLTNNLQSAFASSNGGTALLTVNNAASTFNTVNCTAVNGTYCQSLNRKNCSTTVNTCGGCLVGFTGIVGDSNSKCQSEESSLGVSGSACTLDDDCLYGNCTAGTCRTPILQCPTAIPDSVCSGNGDCLYVDPSGTLFDSPCLITDIYCSATCLCRDSYGGRDCSLDPTSAAERDRNRAILCQSIIQVTDLSNPSPKLIDSLVASLFESYAPNEVTSTSTQLVCAQALDILTNLIVQGFLVGTDPITTNYLIGLTSKFVEGSGDNSTMINTVMTNITQGIFRTLKNGQAPVEVASNNVRITVRKDLLLDLQDAILSPPLTAEESTYRAPVSKFQIVGDAATYACNSIGGYAHSSVTLWGKNPNANSSSVQSPLLQFSGTFQDVAQDIAEDILRNTTYYITLQFAQEQNFNRTAINQALASPFSAAALNTTFPQCSIYNGEAYVPCGNCSVSTYTNYNVTFLCKDIRKLCQSAMDTSTTTSTNSYGWDHYLHRIYDASEREVDYWSSDVRRSLAGEDDLFSDDSTRIGSGMTFQQYGALLGAVGTEFVATLSANPFNVNIDEAKPVIAFLGSILFILLLGIVYFSKWDSYDRSQLIYANQWPPKQTEYLKKLRYKIKKKKVKMSELQEEATEQIEDILAKNHSKFAKDQQKAEKRAGIKNASMAAISPTGAAASIIATTPTSQTSAVTDGSTEKKKKRNLVFSANISEFFDLCLPEIFEKGSFWALLIAITIRHDYITIFFRASAETNRFIRWIDLFNGILSVIFVSSLFFGIFYANSGECESYETRTNCLAPMNSITSESRCQWELFSPENNDALIRETYGSCSLQPPPSTISFVVIVALTCALVALPLQLLISYILDQYCRHRRELEQIGLNTSYWFGYSLASKEIDFQDERVSRLQQNFQEAEHYYQQHPELKMKTNHFFKPRPSPTSTTVRNEAAVMAVANTFTIEEEMEDICQHVQQHYYQNNFITTNFTKLQTDAWQESFTAKTRAIIRYFGLFPDGSFKPLSFYEFIFYRSPRHKLEKRILKARQRAADLKDELEELAMISTQLKEVVLLHHFILEQFSPFKKWILENQLLCFQGFIPNKIDAIPWFTAWAFVYAVFGFYFYWILTWGFQNGALLYPSWGWNLAIDIIQDILFVQVLKVVLLYMIAVLSIRPQLVEIRYQLHAMALAFLQGFIPLRKYITHATKDFFTVVQHISPSCRLAWTNQYESLVMAKILRNIDDYDMLQFRKNYDYRMIVLPILIVILPIAIYFFGSLAGDVIVEVILPVASSGFVIVNYFLYTVSVDVLIIPYVVAIVLIAWYFLAYKRTKAYFARQASQYQSYRREQQEIRRLRRRDHLQRKTSIVKEGLRSLYRSISQVSLQLAIVCSPGLWWKGKKQLKDSHQTTWCFMNYPDRLQPRRVLRPTSSSRGDIDSQLSLTLDSQDQHLRSLLSRSEDDFSEHKKALSDFHLQHDLLQSRAKVAFEEKFNSSPIAPEQELLRGNSVNSPGRELALDHDDSFLDDEHLDGPLSDPNHPLHEFQNLVEDLEDQKSNLTKEEDDEEEEEGFEYADFDDSTVASHTMMTVPDSIRALRVGGLHRIIKYETKLKELLLKRKLEAAAIRNKQQKSTKDILSSTTTKVPTPSHFLEDQVYQESYQRIMHRLQRSPDYLTRLLQQELLNTNPEYVSIGKAPVSPKSDRYLYNYFDLWEQRKKEKSTYNRPKRRPLEGNEQEEVKSLENSFVFPRQTSSSSTRSVHGRYIPFIRDRQFYTDDRRKESLAMIYLQRQLILYDIPNAILHMIILYLHILLPQSSDYELRATTLMLQGNHFHVLISDIEYLLTNIWSVYYPFGQPFTSEEITEIVTSFHQWTIDQYSLARKQKSFDRITPITRLTVPPGSPATEEDIAAVPEMTDANFGSFTIEFAFFQEWFEEFLLTLIQFYQEKQRFTLVRKQLDQHLSAVVATKACQRQYEYYQQFQTDEDDRVFTHNKPSSILYDVLKGHSEEDFGYHVRMKSLKLSPKSSSPRHQSFEDPSEDSHGVVKEMMEHLTEQKKYQLQLQESQLEAGKATPPHFDRSGRIRRQISEELMGKEIMRKSVSLRASSNDAGLPPPPSPERRHQLRSQFNLDTTTLQQNYRLQIAPQSLDHLLGRNMLLSRSMDVDTNTLSPQREGSTLLQTDRQYRKEMKEAFEQRKRVVLSLLGSTTTTTGSSSPVHSNPPFSREMILSNPKNKMSKDLILADYYEEKSSQSPQLDSSVVIERQPLNTLEEAKDGRGGREEEEKKEETIVLDSFSASTGKEEKESPTEGGITTTKTSDVTRTFRERGLFFFAHPFASKSLPDPVDKSKKDPILKGSSESSSILKIPGIDNSHASTTEDSPKKSVRYEVDTPPEEINL